MAASTSTASFQVTVLVQAAGPIRSRTKHKKHRLLRAETNVVLPFVPFPGLYLTFSQKRKRTSLTLYLRVRAVEWNVTESRFDCVADEMLGSSLFDETHEVRGVARIEQHFSELENALREFGFDVSTDADGMMALHKREDGTLKESAAYNTFPS